jgi:hypothetical protein
MKQSHLKRWVLEFKTKKRKKEKKRKKIIHHYLIREKKNVLKPPKPALDIWASIF